MKNKTSVAVVLLVIAIIAIAGCTSGQSKDAYASQEKQPSATTAAVEQKTANPQQLAKNLYEFDKESYEAALSEGKYVFLDFHANWCSICKSEEPSITAAFNELGTNNVVGFRVNYNDDQTDADERELAKKFNVPYQHTKLVVLPNEKVVSRNYQGPASKQEITNQIKAAISG